MVKDLLNPKINVPTSKSVDSYVQSTAKHRKMGQKLRKKHFALLEGSYGTSEYGSRQMFSVYRL